MLNTEKISAKFVSEMLAVVLVVVIVILGVSYFKNKPFYINGTKWGFDGSNELSKKNVELEGNIANLNKTIIKLNSRIDNLSLENEKYKNELKDIKEKIPYSREVKVHLNENFVDSISGFKFSIISFSQSLGEESIYASLYNPEVGDFEREIKITDDWVYYNNGKKYYTSFVNFNMDNSSVTLYIKEL
ncbi:hypothetical protein P3592_05630 [Vibrio parahaemolyticus]|nr:hypothetical protein [Vibrio parahaemolyticus]MDF4851249.1 hypothetical protein [Vibrio parahaemolyticus]